MKKILMLGGSYFQISAIRMAKELKYYVITCDYLPENPGHKFADEYHNVSTTDKEAVLELAKKLKIDGIVAYASDPAAPTAAYVAEKLGLPGNPYNSVQILTHKNQYREFLKKHKFATPNAIEATSAAEFKSKAKVLRRPFVIKPIDSSGSRGVTVVDSKTDIDKAIEHAFSYSRDKVIIGEDFVSKKGYQIAGDGFVVNGKLAFRYFGNEHFDETVNGIVPIGESFPYKGSEQLQKKVHDEVQRLLSLLGMRNGALNFDIRIDKDDQVHLMEVGPRNGGNLIPEVTYLATGVDMIKYTVMAAMGEEIGQIVPNEEKNYFSSYIIHGLRNGKFKGLHVDNWLKDHIVAQDVWKKPGEEVKPFSGSDQTIGTCIFKFGSMKEMVDTMDNANELIRVQYDD